MTAVLFPVGLLALVLAMCLRAPGRGGKRGGALWFFAGLAYAALFIRLGVGAMEILRPSPYDAFITQAASSDDPAPVALFLDASYSRNAIDDDSRASERGLSELAQRERNWERVLVRICTHCGVCCLSHVTQ